MEVPPLWHTVVTVRLTFSDDDITALKATQNRLESSLREIEGAYPLSPAGVFIQVGYGLPYFRARIPSAITDVHMPRSALPGSEGEWAIIDAVRFPKDPADLVLEQNEMVFHILSDFQAHVEDTVNALFLARNDVSLNGIPVEGVYLGDALQVTTIRRGFVGKNMPRLMGRRAGIAGADHIPEGSMLFMGFTSSGTDSVASSNAPSFETIPGFTTVAPPDYFAHGTSMHLSRTAIDIKSWYSLNSSQRLQRMFHPRAAGDPSHLTHQSVPLPLPRDGRIMALDPVQFTEGLMEYDASRHGVVGHGMQLHGHDRIFRAQRTSHGEFLGPGSVYFLRQDFNTVENPFAYSIDDEIAPSPCAGLHFVGFGPSSQQYEQMRLKMDSHDLQHDHGLPDDSVGISRFLTTSHRQNFLLPPRAHRSMPLAELIG